jgi:hypothetical protein
MLENKLYGEKTPNRQRFFTLTKTNQKGQPITCSAFSGISCAAHKKLTPRKVVSLRRVVFLLFVVLLGCVKWLEKSMMVFVIWAPFCPAEHHRC